MYKALGYFFVVLGLIGAVVPLLPTTPLILLAAGCFAKSSPELHQKLLNHKLMGPIIEDWEANRCIDRKIRRVATASLLIFGGSSALFVVPAGYMQVFACLIIGGSFWAIYRIPLCECSEGV